MTIRLFWRLPLRPPATSRLLALVAAVTMFAAAAHASKPPDWVVAAAHVTLPKFPPKTDAVMLYSDQQTTISSNGEVETHYRRVYKILRAQSSTYQEIDVFSYKDFALTYLKGWSLAPDGTSNEVKKKDALETAVDPDDLYSSTHTFALMIPASAPGVVVAYEYVRKGRPNIAEDDWDFQDTIPVLDARFSLSIPSGWKYAVYWANHPSIDPQSPEPGELSWELHNIPAVAVEDYMPPWRAVAGHMAVKYDSPENLAQAQQAGSWHDIGLWYNTLSADRLAPTPAIRQEVASLTANHPELLDKIRAIAAYVQQNVRYVAIEIGIGGWQPHPAGQVFAKQYGDCKDKATLLSSMLSVIGVKSYYAVAQVQRGIVQRGFPSLESFDHVIVAIQLPPKTVAPDLFATINDPKLGKLLYFDATDEYVPFGYLPSSLQDNFVLLVAPGGGELVHLPLLPPTTNRLMRTGAFTLQPDGNLTGSVKEVRWGEPAAYSREEFLDAVPADRSKILSRFLGTFLDDFDMESATLGNLHNFGGIFTENYSFVARGYMRTAGNLLLLRPAVLGRKEPGFESGKKRKYPVEFSATTLQTDDFQFTLPPGYVVDELPQPTDVDCGAIAYHSSVTAKGGQIEYKRTYTIRKVLVPVAQLPALRAAAAKIAADERTSIILRQAAN